MNNPDLQVRIGVIAALTAAIPDHPIRDMMAGPDDELPYILLSSQTSANDSLKTQFGTQSTLMIQVLGKKSLTVSRYEIDEIADTVLQTLIPQDAADYVTVTGFQVVQVQLDSLNDDTITENDGVTARKLIRVRFTLREADTTT